MTDQSIKLNPKATDTPTDCARCGKPSIGTLCGEHDAPDTPTADAMARAKRACVASRGAHEAVMSVAREIDAAVKADRERWEWNTSPMHHCSKCGGRCRASDPKAKP